VSTLLHATVYVFLHSLLNVLVQIENKMGLQKKKNTRVDLIWSVSYRDIFQSPKSHFSGKCSTTTAVNYSLHLQNDNTGFKILSLNQVKLYSNLSGTVPVTLQYSGGSYDSRISFSTRPELPLPS
jgi:hypothetical protein